MKYYDLVKLIQGLIDEHDFVETYGYGDISDISFPDSEDAPNYIYAFLNPAGQTISERQFSATFNLIVMEQVNDGDDNELEGQSVCMSVIQDILAQLYKRTEDGYELVDVEFPVSVEVFKERFQDDVVGATATMTINYGKPLDGCNNPFNYS